MASTSPRVERGAALLDMTAPGWETRIDLDMLNLSNSSYCILGQLYGNYDDGLRILDGKAEERPIMFGFLNHGAEHYPSLTEKWKRAIRRRLRAVRAA